MGTPNSHNNPYFIILSVRIGKSGPDLLKVAFGVFGAFLHGLAGLLDVLAEAFGSVAGRQRQRLNNENADQQGERNNLTHHDSHFVSPPENRTPPSGVDDRCKSNGHLPQAFQVPHLLSGYSGANKSMKSVGTAHKQEAFRK
jgi:hypothetical protein